MTRPALLTAIIMLLIAGIALGTVRSLAWMETPGFCSQCHTMRAEVEAHTRSPHQTVECTECHTGRGIGGFVEAKWDGVGQMLKVLTGADARPIQPDTHNMPPANETCLRCHNPSRQRGDLLITRSYFQEDAANSEQRVALVVRLSDDAVQGTTGIHWHVMSKVEYIPRDEEGRHIDWIGVEREDGTREEFISRETVEISEQAAFQAKQLKATGQTRRMTCYDCHNRVGHTFPSPVRAIDEAMTDSRIEPGLPQFKKRAMKVTTAKYDTLAEGYEAIARLRRWYHLNYPYLFLESPAVLKRSLDALTDIYHLTANPELGTFPDAYPDFLGHTDSAGCFRCHDGGHYKIGKEGRLTEEAIPSRCSLCHTFPSVGQKTPNVMLGPPPDSHGDRLWVFDHAKEAPSLDPGGTTCSACHSQTYCSNCHSVGAINIKHDNMYFDHAAVIRESGKEACSYCHQKPFCERCHEADDPKTSLASRQE